jgi:hypothetical protein
MGAKRGYELDRAYPLQTGEIKPGFILDLL